jgi:hypothetical protein
LYPSQQATHVIRDWGDLYNYETVLQKIEEYSICENSGEEPDTSADSSAENRGAESVRTVGRNRIHQQTVLQKTEEQNL